jgi:ketosteroid isomerase-like protein
MPALQPTTPMRLRLPRTAGIRYGVALMLLVILTACAGPQPRDESSEAAEEVRLTERAFAKSMADRDFQAFVSRLSTDAIFFDDAKTLHGRNEVANAWKPYFSQPKAPFAWAPDHVEVLASGDLALSTGPVTVGDRTVARFNSIWRREGPHTWRIVFDKGEPVCDPNSSCGT